MMCMFINLILTTAIGLVCTVVSISHCGCDDPGSITGLDSQTVKFCIFLFSLLMIPFYFLNLMVVNNYEVGLLGHYRVGTNFDI